MKREITPRKKYGDRLRREIFGDGITNRSAATLAELTGAKPSTVRAWRQYPERIPAWWAEQVRELLNN